MNKITIVIMSEAKGLCNPGERICCKQMHRPLRFAQDDNSVKIGGHAMTTIDYATRF
jgi:hypothetical protein